jgi:hypothetical protein
MEQLRQEAACPGLKAGLDAQSAAIVAFLNTGTTIADDGPRVHGR